MLQINILTFIKKLILKKFVFCFPKKMHSENFQRIGSNHVFGLKILSLFQATFTYNQNEIIFVREKNKKPKN